MNRVKFYSTNDLTCGNNLKYCERLLIDIDLKVREIQGINDILEIYNAKKYFDINMHLEEWTPDTIHYLEKIILKCMAIVARLVKSINDANLLTVYNEVEINYKDDFWELIEHFKVFENITREYFREFIRITKPSMDELLKCRNLTIHFGEIIKHYMIENTTSSTILLLSKYEMNHIGEQLPIYFPKELSDLDKEVILSTYIDSIDPNLNYVRLIANIQSNKNKLVISPKTLLKAKRKAAELEKAFFKDGTGVQLETCVIFSKSVDKVVKMSLDGQRITAVYDSNWIHNNSDFPTLLNNFIYLFEFVDMQMRCTLINKKSEMEVLERYIISSSQNAYIKGFEFDQKNILSLLQLSGYYRELLSVGIRIEEVIEWFFEIYLSKEFNARNFKVRMPSSNSYFFEKCTNIMPALESVLKQFTLYIEEGHIDFELLDIRSEHLLYKNIPSFINKKYVYGVGEEFSFVTHILFSDQSGLGYYKMSKKAYDNFFDLLISEEVKISEIADFNIKYINWLIDYNYLHIDVNGMLFFRDMQQVILLYDLYINEVVCYWKYPESDRKILDDLEDRNVVEFESSLFSRPEHDYINYLLNKSKYNNGLDLRNRYSHTQPSIGDDDEIHNQNYLVFLRLFIIAIIKINDEFCTQKFLNLTTEKCLDSRGDK